MEKIDQSIIDEYINILEFQSQYSKILPNDIIDELLKYFDTLDVSFIQYPNMDIDSLSIALDFYKSYNINYYNTIIKGIDSKKIVIDSNDTKTLPEFGITTIKMSKKNSKNIYKFVHEFAHYIDICANPQITGSKMCYNSYCEVFSYLIEMIFDNYLIELGYTSLPSIRNNNKLYSLKSFIDIIRYQLEYERQYRENSLDFDIEKVKMIMENKTNNIVNYYLRYYIGYLYAYYLYTSDYQISEKEFIDKCNNIDIKKALTLYKENM